MLLPSPSPSFYPIADENGSGQAIAAILAVLEQVEQVVESTPPVENGKSRFGNPAFRTFYDRVREVRPLSSLLRRSEALTGRVGSLEIGETPRRAAGRDAGGRRRARRVLLRELGKPREDRLWEWDGVELLVLAVSCCSRQGVGDRA